MYTQKSLSAGVYFGEIVLALKEDPKDGMAILKTVSKLRLLLKMG
jgi:hypothetical protein